MMQMLVRAEWSCSRYGDNKVFLRFIVSPQGLCLASDATQCEVSASALVLGGIPERVQWRPKMRTKLIMLSLAASQTCRVKAAPYVVQAAHAERLRRTRLLIEADL